MKSVITVIIFLLVIGSIIIIHELGHFIAAKYFGVYCHQFSIGFGPKIWSYQGRETQYELRLLPFGGFVSMAGEEDQSDNENLKDIPFERTLKGAKTYQKVIIFLAGIFMNFVLTLVILFGMNLTVGRIPVQVAQIGDIVSESAADKYGLEVNDVIKEITVEETGQTFPISSFQDIQLNQNKIKEDLPYVTLIITVERNEQNHTVKLVSQFNEETQSYQLGVIQASTPMNFVDSVRYTFIGFYRMSTSIFTSLGLLMTNFKETVTQLSGPVGIYSITKEVTQTGQIANVFRLIALLSVNIGIFNLLPIPGLDGCQVLFALAEKIIGREIPENFKITLQLIGFGLVIFLMLFVTYQDIIRLLN